MATTTRAVAEEAVRAAIAAVPDPEMPPVSVTDLGMLVDVRVLEEGAATGAGEAGAAETRVEVDLVATYSGCPATRLIAEDVAAAVRALPGVGEVDVRFVTHVTWTPERISPEGRARLRAFGIAAAAADDADDAGASGATGAGGAGAVPPGVRALPLAARPVRCPVCGSDDTMTDSLFGPTPCRSTHYCRACRNPFEAIKD